MCVFFFGINITSALSIDPFAISKNTELAAIFIKFKVFFLMEKINSEYFLL